MKPGTPGFIGGRLTEAREIRGLRMQALAELLGVSKQLISQYESGDVSPSPERMAALASVLKVSLAFFLRAETGTEPGVLFFRSKLTTSNTANARSARRFAWLREMVAAFRRYIRFPTVNFPDYHPPTDPFEITDQTIETLANQTRRFWSLGDGPISDVVRLLENNGAIIARSELGCSEVDAYSKWGISDQTPYIILGCDKGSAARSRFDVAHELGHLVLHRNVLESSISEKAIHAVIEKQAHYFAGAFLLPQESFSHDFYSPTLDAFRAMKGKWKVSIGAMISRSANLGLISPEVTTRLWMNMSRRRWKTNEPLDDILEAEQPKLLERSIKLLTENQLLTIQDISSEFGYSIDDIETILGLEPGVFAGREVSVTLRSPNEISGLPTSSEERLQTIRISDVRRPPKKA